MTLAALWGCTPAQLRDVTWAEYAAMTELAAARLARAQEG